LFRDYHLYLAESRALISGAAVVPHFVYPPLLALVLMPIARLPDTLADAIWWIAQAGVLVCYGRVLAGVLSAHGRLRWPLAAALLLTSLPVLHDLKWGQISDVIVLLGALWLITPSRGSAFGLGFAAACKLFPLAFALPPLLWPQRRLVWQVAAWALALGLVLPLFVLGGTPTLQTWQHVARSLHELDALGSIPASQDLASAIRQWFGPPGRVGVYVPARAWLFPLPLSAEHALYWSSALLLSTITGHAARNARGGSPSVAAILMLVVPLLSPLAWEHYYCALPLAIAVALARPDMDPRVLGLALLAWAIPALGEWAQLFDDWDFFTYESLHATTIAAVLAVAAVWAADRDARRREPGPALEHGRA
jgi:hypothetical protein